MTEVCLGFKAFDAHELLCHFVAMESGLYEQFGVKVRLLDSNFLSDKQLPDNIFHVACGAALLNWLQGAALKVVLVATEKPMFWLYGHPEVKGISSLAGMRIASYPANAPPAKFLQILLDQEGFKNNPPRIEAARDDAARLGLLLSGDVGAAVMSSAISQAFMIKRGFRQLRYFGDHLRLPTTGLAVPKTLMQTAPDLVAMMVRILQRSLQLIQADRALVCRVLTKYFSVPEGFVDADCKFYQKNFSVSGASAGETIEKAVSIMSQQLCIDSHQIPQDCLYDFRFVERRD